MKNPILLLFFFTVSFYGQQDSDYWLNQGKLAWTENDSLFRYNQAETPCTLGSSNDMCGQEIYYSGWAASWLLNAFRKSGDVKHLNELIDFHYIYLAKSSTVNVGGTNYVGWPTFNPANSTEHPYGIPLFETYFYRYHTTALRIIKDDATLLATNHGQPGSVTWPGTTYQDIYDDILDFLETDLYGKFKAGGWGNLYRSLIHMTSHWARITMELYEITGTQEYLDVYNNMVKDGFPSGVGLPATRVGENFIDMGYYSGTNYLFDMDMDNNQFAVQDTDHSLDTVQFMIEAYWLNTLSSTEYHYDSTIIEGLKETMLNLLYVSPLANGRDTEQNIDGTGGFRNSASISGWYLLAGWEPEVSTFINSELTDRTDMDPSHTTYRRSDMIGNLVMGLAIQEGSNHYPLSNNVPVTGLVERRLKKDSETIGF